MNVKSVYFLRMLESVKRNFYIHPPKKVLILSLLHFVKNPDTDPLSIQNKKFVDS
jgi:hypothetical protein